MLLPNWVGWLHAVATTLRSNPSRRSRRKWPVPPAIEVLESRALLSSAIGLADDAGDFLLERDPAVQAPQVTSPGTTSAAVYLLDD